MIVNVWQSIPECNGTRQAQAAALAKLSLALQPAVGEQLFFEGCFFGERIDH
jgi:hypothetical protein